MESNKWQGPPSKISLLNRRTWPVSNTLLMSESDYGYMPEAPTFVPSHRNIVIALHTQPYTSLRTQQPGLGCVKAIGRFMCET
jgi:hypothetical protein